MLVEDISLGLPNGQYPRIAQSSEIREGNRTTYNYNSRRRLFVKYSL